MFRRATIALLLLFTTGVVVVASPAAGQAKEAASLFRIRNTKSGLYLQNAGGSISNGVTVAQYPRNTDGNQRFQEVVDGSYRTFMHVTSGLNMGINRGNTLPGAKAVLAHGSAAFNQDWQVVTRTGSIVELRNRASGLCLGIYDASTAAGAVAAQFPCDGGTNQGWQKIFIV